MPGSVDTVFGPDNLGGWVDNCCVDGLNGCVGVCVSSTSTVTAMTTANPKAHTLPISELAIGDKVLAATSRGKHVFEEVEGLPHGKSPASEHFVELAVARAGSPAQVVRATPHHTFPACSHGHTSQITTTKAKDFKAGDCVMTEHGKATVTSAAMTPAAKDEEAYTIELKGKGSSLVAVNGIFTHASPADMGKHRHSAKRQKALRGAAPPALSGFQEHVVNALQSHLKATVSDAVAKAAKAAKA